MKRITESKKKSKLLPILCYAAVPLFFSLVYLMMYMTYEDIFQKNTNLNSSIFEIWKDIYEFIPRIGEFYQRTVVHFMTIKASFGVDLLFRILDIFYSTALIYFCEFFILKRRPKLQLKDAMLFTALFLSLLLGKTSENFTYRFSYVNNYIIAMLISILFLLPFRLKRFEAKIYYLPLFILLGFLFGISTEVMPIAFLIIIFGYCFYRIFFKKEKILHLITNNKVQVAEILGLLAGLIFFYLGAGLKTRTNGGYAEVYDYVGVSTLIHQPIVFIYKYISHFWYNLRYIGLSIPLIGFIIHDLKKRTKTNPTTDSKKELFWVVTLAIFNFLFICACSLIAVHDDLFPRMAMPLLLSNIAIIYIYINTLIKTKEIETKTIKRISVALLSVALLLSVDWVIGFTAYHNTIDPSIQKIHFDGDGAPEIELIDVETAMHSTPLFKLKQLSPFNWN